MGYRWVDHTGELELRVEAGTEEDVFGDALRALAELLDDGDTKREQVSFEVTIEAADRATLLARWLEELAYRAEVDELVADQLERLVLDGAKLAATVRARRGAPPHLVKGVTYHRLSFEASGDGYGATVVLDV
jgi:SHS2 domain-containing protein